MRKRNISIPIRVTEKELSVIDKKAARARLTRTEYLITCAFGKEITLIEDLKPILADLRRIGNNLNQLTRLANMGKIVGNSVCVPPSSMRCKEAVTARNLLP